MSPRSWRRFAPATLRARVTVLAALAVLGVLTAASAGLVLAQRATLVHTLDEALDRQADVVVGQLAGGLPVRARDLPADDVLVEVVGDDGAVVAASDGLSGRLPWDGRPADGADPVSVELPGDGPGRLLARDAGDLTVLVAGSLDDVRDSTAALAGSLLVAVPLIAAVLAGVLWWAVGRALQPVEDIRARVDTISARRLDARVPQPATPEEVARLARTMNAMLGRLEQAVEAQRRFVADASHELRSPLARMRAELEVDALHPGSADPPATAASVLAETVALQRLVDDLLLLARGDAGALEATGWGPVDLDDLVDRVVADLLAAGERRIDAHGVRPAQVTGAPDQLRRIVSNLLDNAVRHARDRIVVTLAELPGERVELAVSDDGPGVPPADRDRVFQRFTRLDDARSGRDGGAGLGLAIARDIAARHGGTLTVDHQQPGARFVLALPGVAGASATAGLRTTAPAAP